MRTIEYNDVKLLIESRYDQSNNKYLDLYVLLPKEKHRREVGRISISDRQFHIKRHSQKHILRANNAYGMNYQILSEGVLFDTVVIHEEDTGKIFKMDKMFILKDGQFLQFKQQGFERQIFVTKEWLSYYEVTNEAAKRILKQTYSRM